MRTGQVSERYPIVELIETERSAAGERRKSERYPIVELIETESDCSSSLNELVRALSDSGID